MENLYIIIGERIRNRRKELKYKQEQLANNIGINRTSISNIEKGRHQAPLHLLYKISIFINMDIYDLIPTKDEIIRQDFVEESTSLYNLLDKNRGLSENSKNDIEQLLKELE